MTNRLPLAAAALLLAAGAAAAQDPAPAPVADTHENYRWAIYTSCTVAFVAIAIYLMITHRRAAEASGEMDAVERRLDELEKDDR